MTGEAVERAGLSAQDLWRAVVLYGLNTATYKIALGRTLIDLASEGVTRVDMDELAQRFFAVYEQRLDAGLPQQSIPGRKTVLERAVEEFRAGSLTRDQAVDRVRRQGFGDVVPRFHTVNGAAIPMRFYEATSDGLVLTDHLLGLFSSPGSAALAGELGSRWDLLEAAFSMRLPKETLAVDEFAVFRSDGRRRTPITSTRPVLHGYQNGACFYCGEDLGDDVHVDHVIPWSVVGHDEIWNLVLAHGQCNLAKSDLLPSLEDMYRLYMRNEYFIASNHPIKRYLIQRMGDSPEKRRAYLSRVYEVARRQKIHVWGGMRATAADPLQSLKLVSGT